MSPGHSLLSRFADCTHSRGSFTLVWLFPKLPPSLGLRAPCSELFTRVHGHQHRLGSFVLWGKVVVSKPKDSSSFQLLLGTCI